MAEHTVHECCLRGFHWGGTPTGHETNIGDNSTYVVNEGKEVAIMVIHDLAGWTAANTRLLADHYAAEVDATVYVPDL
jgi:hypothetical protein